MRSSLALLAVLAAAAPASAELLVTQKDALARAFPDAQVEKRTAYLTEAQAEAASRDAQAKVADRVWTYYVGVTSAGPAGYAYFDRVVVRTMPAALMAAVAPDGSLRFVEILTFDEPRDYLPRPAWLRLFEDRPLDEELRVHGAIRNVAGSTLTSHAVTDSVRRMLAVHRTLHAGDPR